MTLPTQNASGVKREHEHREGCHSVQRGDGQEFVVLDREHGMLFGRRRNGNRGGSTMWWQFACNDIQCPARLLIRWDVMAEAVNGLNEEPRHG